MAKETRMLASIKIKPNPMLATKSIFPFSFRKMLNRDIEYFARSPRMGDALLPLLFFDTAWRLLATLMGIGGVIFFHELGHFLVARWCGVRTEAFSLAFPPNLLFGQREAGGFRLRWIGGTGPGILLPFWKSERDPTEYRLGLIPLGGYVKMAGEGIGEGTGEPDELRSKSVGKRGAIFSAGVQDHQSYNFSRG